MHFSGQEHKSSAKFDLQYEPSIYLHGKIQTRPENWHDFFNFCVWLTFPKTKVLLNAIHYHSLLNRKNNNVLQRTVNENIGALFDECGVIVVTTKQQYIELLQRHRWVELFCDHREEIVRELKFFVFGHGLYEKCLQPYLGLTGKGLCFVVDDNFFLAPLPQQLQRIDELTLHAFSNLSATCVKDILTPIPLLGYPDWYREQNLAFYQNEKYFRPL